MSTLKDLKEFKKDSKNHLAKISKKLEELKKSKSNSREDDNRFWKPTIGKDGNGAALIRFLPACPKEKGELPWVSIWRHSFQGPTGLWYIENSLTTLGQQDPVSEYNTKLWKSGDDKDKDLARKQKRRLKYIANILVINDPSNPENNGKVFLYEFGPKIFEKITEAMNPSTDGLDDDEKPEKIDPFDFWTGANFKVKIKTVAGYPNYDASKFVDSSPLSEEDEEIVKVWNSEYELLPFVAPENFKSYDNLKSRLDRVLGLTEESDKPKKSVNLKDLEDDDSPAVKEKDEDIDSSLVEDSTSSDTDEDLEYFQSLVESN